MVYADSIVGADIYRRSLAFLLCMAWYHIHPETHLTISHSMGHAFYFIIDNTEAKDEKKEEKKECVQSVSQELLDQLHAEMNKIIADNLPILSSKPMSNQQAIKIFEKQNNPFTVALLKSRNETRIIVSQCGDYFQLAHMPMVAQTSQLKHYELSLKDDMIVLIFPSHHDPTEVPEFKHNVPLSQIYHEYGNWARVMGIESIGQLNQINRTERFKSYV